MRDFRHAKTMARTLRASLAAKGFQITVSQSLELIAEAFGVADWNTLSAAIQADAAGGGKSSSVPRLPNGFAFSAALESTLHRAVAYANDRRHQYATLEHLLLALIDDADASAVMTACKVDLAALKSDLVSYIDNNLTALAVENSECRPTAAFERVLQRAVIHVQSSGREQITGANVLVAIFAERESHAAYFLQEQGMTRLDAINYLTGVIISGGGRH